MRVGGRLLEWAVSPQIIPKHASLGRHFAAQRFGEGELHGGNSLSLNDSGGIATEWHAS